MKPRKKIGRPTRKEASLMKYDLLVSLVLAIVICGAASAAEKPLRLAQGSQGQTSFACTNNCNSQYSTCSNQCPSAGTLSQNQADINAGQVITQNRIDILQNNQPIQCRLNCTSQQQACYATCR